MQIYHLSHIDLDGYSCQYVLRHFCKDIVFFNSNYGKEINENFTRILNLIDKKLELNPSEKSLVLISDLNLNLTQCEEFERALDGKNTFLLLLDHHQNGLECALTHKWYFLDDKRCATKIVYDFFSEIYGKNETLEDFVNLVNAVDLWLKDEKYFELGKVCLMMIATAKELNKIMFEDEYMKYIFFLLRHAQQFIHKEASHIQLDDALHFLKKEFFKDGKNDSLGNLISAYVTNLLTQNKEKFSIFYEGHKGLLTYNIGNTSVIGNDFLVQNENFDFFIDVSSKKTLSFRANNKIDVSLMAKKLVNGGGHKNASGGLFATFKDSSNYEVIKAQIVDLITTKAKQ